jgi:hypothetical protein
MGGSQPYGNNEVSNAMNGQPMSNYSMPPGQNGMPTGQNGMPMYGSSNPNQQSGLDWSQMFQADAERNQNRS